MEADFSVGDGIVSLTCIVTTEEPVDCELHGVATHARAVSAICMSI